MQFIAFDVLFHKYNTVVYVIFLTADKRGHTVLLHVYKQSSHRKRVIKFCSLI